MSWKKKNEGLEASTQKQTGNFLFQKGELDESQYLDMRTDIQTRAEFKALFYLGTLSDAIGSKFIKESADRIKRMNISIKKGGRIDAVEVLRSPQFPEPRTTLEGREKYEYKGTGEKED